MTTDYKKGFDDGWGKCKLAIVTFFRMKAAQHKGEVKKMLDSWADTIMKTKNPGSK